MNLNQFNAISALRQYKNSEALDLQLFNDGGVCLSLAMCFARAHLVEPSATESPEVFEDFLMKWQTKEGVKTFFEEYDLLKQRMLQAKRGLITLSTQELQELNMKMSKIQTQMAYYDTAVMIYAQNASDYTIGLQPNYYLRTLQFAGLDFTGSGAAFSISPEELSSFFFQRDSVSQSAIISPFSPGGTYLLGFPGHACAVHVSPSGDIKLYDPNRASYITSKEDFDSYMSAFNFSYVSDSSITDKVEVTVYLVNLKNKLLEKNDSIEALEQAQEQMTKATERLLTKIDIHSKDCLVNNNFWKNLFCNKSPLSEAMLQDILARFGGAQDSRQRIHSACLAAFQETRNAQLFEVCLRDPSLTQQEFNRLLAFANSSMHGGHALSYLITHIPEHLSLLSDNTKLSIKASIKAALPHEAEDWPQSILAALFEKMGPQEALKALLELDDMDISCFSIEYWAKFNKKNGLHSAFELNSSGLVKYMVENNFPEKNILALLKSQSYLLRQDDYDCVLQSQYPHVTKMLLEMDSDAFLVGVTPASSLVKAAISENLDLMRTLLSQEGSERYPLDDKINAAICAVTAGNQEIAQLLLDSLDKTEDKKILGSKALVAALLAGYASISRFLMNEKQLRVLPADESSLFAIPDRLEKAIMNGQDEALEPWLIACENQSHLINIPKNAQGWSLLMLAIKFEKFDMVNILLQHGASTVEADFYGKTPLMKAFEKGNLDLIVRLASREGLNAKDRFGWTVTMQAINSNKPKELEILLQKAPELQHTTSRGETALMLAAQKSPEALKLLLAHGLDNINERDHAGNTALMHAVKNGQCDSAKILIEMGAQLELSNNEGQTALTLSDFGGNSLLLMALGNFEVEFAESLIQAGASCEARNRLGESAPLLAVKHADEILALVLAHSSQNAIDAVSVDGEFALGVVSGYRKPAKLQAVLAAGADICTANQQGKTPLMIAASSGSPDVCAELLQPQYRDALNMQDSRGNTAFMKAIGAVTKAVEKSELFLATNEVDLSVSNNQGQTALMLAACLRMNGYKLVQMILEKSTAEINNTDRDGNTALMLAIRKNNVESVQALIAAGADLHITNHLGQSALDLARGGTSELIAITALLNQAITPQTQTMLEESNKPSVAADSLFKRASVSAQPYNHHNQLGL